MIAKKEIALATVRGLASGFLYYDRKEDAGLSREDVERLIRSGELTADEIVAEFSRSLKEAVARNYA